jgi:hypothetical protein
MNASIPYLIPGVYVIVTSLEPLRMYFYRNVLLRMCELPYPPNGPNAGSNPKSYVVKDYLPPWENADLKAYYKETPTTTRPGKLTDETIDNTVHPMDATVASTLFVESRCCSRIIQTAVPTND